jgi:cytidyltransferase-like protein
MSKPLVASSEINNLSNAHVLRASTAETPLEQEPAVSTARAPHKIRIYVDGVFDLFHAGHIAFLKQARLVVDAAQDDVCLVVGVITDEDAGWKRRPFVSHADRTTMLRYCRLVDEIVERPPLVLDKQFIRDHGIDFVVHGDDDPQTAFFAVPIELKIMRYVKYTAGTSTTEIARRIRQASTAEKSPTKT